MKNRFIVKNLASAFGTGSKAGGWTVDREAKGQWKGGWTGVSELDNRSVLVIEQPGRLFLGPA